MSQKGQDSISIEIRNQNLEFKDKEDLSWFFEESAQYKEFLNELQEDSVVYDIGSYHGFYAILGSLGQKSYAFEMDRKNFNKLKLNKSLNSEKDIEVFNKAVWDQNTHIRAETGKEGGNMVKKGKTTVEAVKIDSFVEEHKKPDIFKIDVEGAGYQVLQGAKKTLETKKPIIFIELHVGEKLESFNSSEKDINQFLKNLGYNLEYRHERGEQIHAKYS